MAFSNPSPSTALSEHWVCPKCAMKNSTCYVNCVACLTHKPGHSLQGSVSQGGMVRTPLSFRLRSLVKPPEWKCPTCTVINEGYLKQCKTCGSLRFTKQPPKSNSREGEGKVGRRNGSGFKETSGDVSVMDRMLGLLQLTKSEKQKRTKEGKRAQEQWACHVCTLLNSLEQEKCAACETCRPSNLKTIPHPQGKSSTGVLAKPPSPLPCNEGHVTGHFPTIHPLSSMTTSGCTAGLTGVSINNGLEESRKWKLTKGLNDTRYRDVLMANKVYKEIQQYCMEHGEPFTDPDFPPADKSLYIDPKKRVSEWKVWKWERPLQVRTTPESDSIQWTVLRDPRLEDVEQGNLGNCWLLGALGVIAEQPQLVEDIIITKEFSPKVGAYQIRLCKDGRWQVVVIDDCLPCFKSGKLAFSQAPTKTLWVPFIEKALAKLYGSYEALQSGKLLLGLSVLTGLPCNMIDLKNLSPKDSDMQEGHDLMWARLLSFREHNFPMSTFCRKKDKKDHAEKGLLVGHAYSILDVRQLGSERLLRLRNPWGEHPWKGSWSDQDPRWRSQPWLRDELQAVGNEAGVFWMGACDFFKYFSEVNVCKYRPNWHSVRSEGKLYPFATSRIKTLAFKVHSTTEVDISMYQHTSKCGGSSQLDMAVLVLRYPGTYQQGLDPHSSFPTACTLESTSHFHPIVTTSGFLGPGSYIVLPLAFNHYHHLSRTDREREREKEREESSGQKEKEDGAIPYVVAVFSAQELAYDSIVTGPGFLSESLFLLAEKNGKVWKLNSNMVVYGVCLDDQCHIVVAMNYDSRLHFTVNFTVYENINIISSRGALCTKDCIPPRHRQVLLVLTREYSETYSYQWKFNSVHTELNSQGQWGAEHSPELTPTNIELHSPRFIGFAAS